MAAIDSIGKYQVLGTLGQGAHSTIFHVRRAADSREYALKLVSIDDPEEQKFLDQAEHEFDVAKKFNHPNLIKVYAYETQRDWLFRVRKAKLLIEFVNGKTLDQVPLALEQMASVFYQIAKGLAHMHKNGVYHADLKPNNIMLGKRGEVKVIDYGLSWKKGETKDRVQGTPEYMAPETSKQKTVNEKSDIYNLGATMYRLTTLKLPPSTVATGETMRVNSKAFKSMFVPVSDINKSIPASLCSLIHQCLEYDPDKRPRWMGEVLEELQKVAQDLGTPIEDDE